MGGIIFRLKESADKMPDGLRRHGPPHHSAKAMSRTAAGPDGTRGFHGGRGRPAPPPTALLGSASAPRPSFDALAGVAAVRPRPAPPACRPAP